MGQSFWKIVNYINAETDISKIKIFFDILKCNIKYGFSPVDYNIYKAYNITEELRKNILTKRENKKLRIKYNKIKDINAFKNREIFNKKFNLYLGFNWLYLNGTNIKDYYNFIKDKNIIYALPINLSDKSWKKVNINLKNYTNTYNDLVLSKYSIVIDNFFQNKVLSKLNSFSLNIIRFIVLNGNIYSCYLITSKDKESIIKNNNIYASINLETGIIDYKGITIYQDTYEIHPLSNEKIVNFQIPKWPRSKRLVCKVAEIVKELKYLEIDITISEDKPILLNVNPFPNYQIVQLLNLVNYSTGLKSNINYLLKEKNK